MPAGASAGEGHAPLAQTPPMGWNSFDSYGVYLHEEAAMANLEVMAEKLKPHGYEYFVLDNGWFGEYALQPGTMFAAEKHAHDVRLDENGYFLPSKCYFPGGFEPIVDRCHELGLKFGVHLMRGIPRKAVELNLPIEGTPYRAADIADTDPAENCKWCRYCYGVDMSKPGAQDWYDGLIRHIAAMGVDFIKYDDIVPHPDEVEAVALELNVKPETVMEMESRLSNLDMGFDGADADDEDAPAAPSAFIPDTRLEPAAMLEREDTETSQRERLRAALSSLDERSIQIVTRRWLCEEKQTLHELAGQFGVSAERIRQIEKSAINKLKLQLGL